MWPQAQDLFQCQVRAPYSVSDTDQERGFAILSCCPIRGRNGDRSKFLPYQRRSGPIRGVLALSEAGMGIDQWPLAQDVASGPDYGLGPRLWPQAQDVASGPDLVPVSGASTL